MPNVEKKNVITILSIPKRLKVMVRPSYHKSQPTAVTSLARPGQTRGPCNSPMVEEYRAEKALVQSLIRKEDLPTYELPTTRILNT